MQSLGQGIQFFGTFKSIKSIKNYCYIIFEKNGNINSISSSLNSNY